MHKQKENVILIAAGGTGGHLIPAQQIAELIFQKNYQVVFAAGKLSDSISFDKERFPYKNIAACPISKNILKMFFYIFTGFWQAVFFIHKTKPKLVLGFGSYHTFPLMLAARFLNKKIILFEYNSKMGMVNRFFAPSAKYVATQFTLNLKNEKLVAPLPWNKTFNLLDQKIAREKLNLDPKLKTILFFGGSQGAKTLNKIFLDIISKLKEKTPFQVIHLAGLNEDVGSVKEKYRKNSINAYVKDFEKDMPAAYSACDLAICRSGAGTVSELIHFAIPALLVPYPWAKENHQNENAIFFQNSVLGGKSLLQKDCAQAVFLEEILQFFNDEKLSLMKKNIQNYKLAIDAEKRPHLLDLVIEEG